MHTIITLLTLEYVLKIKGEERGKKGKSGRGKMERKLKRRKFCERRSLSCCRRVAAGCPTSTIHSPTARCTFTRHTVHTSTHHNQHLRRPSPREKHPPVLPWPTVIPWPICTAVHFCRGTFIPWPMLLAHLYRGSFLPWPLLPSSIYKVVYFYRNPFLRWSTVTVARLPWPVFTVGLQCAIYTVAHMCHGQPPSPIRQQQIADNSNTPPQKKSTHTMHFYTIPSPTTLQA